MNEAYNMDCLEYMKTLPDNAFDLAVVDPPYGAGFTEGGLYAAEHRNLRGRFDRYNNTDASSQSVQVEREQGAVQSVRESRKPVRAVQARHGQGKNVRQPDGSWGYAKWRTEAGGGF